MQFRSVHILAIIIFLSIGYWGYVLAIDAQGRALAFSLCMGAAFGIVLQRGRFCFLCNFRDYLEKRETGGLVAILVALGAGVLFYQVIIMAWVPVPQPGRLPPTAHISPSGYVLAIAALVFGLGMALSGSCLSAHLYRLGEGAFGSLAALAGAGTGFFLGFLSWNFLYTATVFDDPSIWLPQHIGFDGVIAASLTILIAIGYLVIRSGPLHHGRRNARTTDGSVAAEIFVHRWPPVITGLLIAIMSALAYFRVSPLGVTAELGSIVRTAAASRSLIPDTLAGLDTVRGCISAVKTTILSPNGLFVSGLVLASLASALAAGQFKATWPTLRGVVERYAGGVMMGWGSMTALGCTVGALLSGIHAGALSGWIFLIFCSVGAWLGLKAKGAGFGFR